MPAVTKNAFGNGAVYYIGTRLDTEGLNKIMMYIVGLIHNTAHISGNQNAAVCNILFQSFQSWKLL